MTKGVEVSTEDGAALRYQVGLERYWWFHSKPSGDRRSLISIERKRRRQCERLGLLSMAPAVSVPRRPAHYLDWEQDTELGTPWEMTEAAD